MFFDLKNFIDVGMVEIIDKEGFFFIPLVFDKNLHRRVVAFSIMGKLKGRESVVWRMIVKLLLADVIMPLLMRKGLVVLEVEGSEVKSNT